MNTHTVKHATTSLGMLGVNLKERAYFLQTEIFTVGLLYTIARQYSFDVMDFTYTNQTLTKNNHQQPENFLLYLHQGACRYWRMQGDNQAECTLCSLKKIRTFQKITIAGHLYQM